MLETKAKISKQEIRHGLEVLGFRTDQSDTLCDYISPAAPPRRDSFLPVLSMATPHGKEGRSHQRP